MDKLVSSILDFDNTLFKTREFWRRELFPALEKKYGFGQDILEKVFERSTTGEVDYFIPARFLEEMCEELSLSGDMMPALQQYFDEIVYSQNTHRYLYDGAEALIRRLQMENRRCLLKSYRDPTFKKRFFKACKISALFPTGDIIVTNQPKQELFKMLPISSGVILVNDSLPEINKLVEVFKQGKVRVRAFLFDPETLLKDEDIIPPTIIGLFL